MDGGHGRPRHRPAPDPYGSTISTDPASPVRTASPADQAARIERPFRVGNMQPTDQPTDQSVDVASLIADPYGTYAVLREAGPVHRFTGPDGRPAWLVTRYDECV